MESYIKPTLKNKPERIIIHCGTNDLKNSTPQSIAKNILSLAKSSQQENNTVLVSSIVPRNDHLDKKGKEVNIILKKRCNEMNLAYISHGNIRTRYHCNYDGLHLNDKGATLFTENILSALNKVAWPQSVKVNSSSKSFSDYDNIRAKGNAFTSTKSIKAKHPKNLFFGHLNVNSIRNKFVSIEELIKRTFDIFLISETKIDDLFPNAQFKIEGYKSFRKDQDAFGGGLLFYVNEKLNCRSLKTCLPSFIDILPLKHRLLNSKWVVLGTYKPPSQNEKNYVSKIQNLLTYHRSSYDNILLPEDFNMSFYNENIKDLCDMCELNHLIKD